MISLVCEIIYGGSTKMLELKDIRKQYGTGDSTVHALSGVSLAFRENEFVSILGPSGCGKTTLLNIIGGLDRYTSGDLVINGKSTKLFKDADWDTYRNHSIGFVFQSYNLIPHQSVLSNVELALTLSGVSKSERRARAIDALRKVGLGDQIHKKPNQMSGGQMQRVAIARALVNNPDILLADEPTGALDTQTSVQIMELLKEVAKEKLVIMVTHNPELAEEYSTRIVRLCDGLVVEDSAPFELSDDERETIAAEAKKAPAKAKKKKKKMSFFTALSLSFNNLLTKKARTILTSFAGSIGIIGIALILSLSNGIQLYIDQVQEDTLSTYPLSIQKEAQDMAAMMSAMMEVSEFEGEIDPNKIYVDDSLGTMMSAMSATVSNDLEKFKAYIEANKGEIDGYVSDIQYTYDFDLQIYTADGKTQVSPTEMFDNMGSSFEGIGELMDSMGGFSIMSEMINNQELLDQQYEIVGGHWPTNKNEVVLVVNKNNQISKMTLYMLGVLPQDELEEIMTELMQNGTYESAHNQEYTLDDFLGMKFYMLTDSDFYTTSGGTYTVNGKTYPKWHDMREYGFGSITEEQFITENGTELVISGIIRPKESASATSISGAVGYTKDLTDFVLKKNLESKIITQQKETPNNNVLDGSNFERIKYTKANIGDLIDRVGTTNMNRFYSMMTAMIINDPQYKGMLEVNGNTVAMFIGTMESKAQAQRIRGMLENAVANDPSGGIQITALLQMVKNVPGLNSVDFTTDNIIDLLPIMSEEQIMLLIAGYSDPNNPLIAVKGLKDLCTEDYMTTLYAEMNADMVNWTINEKSMMLLLENMDDETFAVFEEMLYQQVPTKDATLESNLKLLGDAEKAKPASINFYAKDFESKDKIEAFIKKYNDTRENETEKVQYSDLVGAMMSSISLIINVISYVLIAFVSISLIVSSIMIGIITYISVLERTKEIGILRSIGASKRDISRVFNAETLIVGLTSGIFGIIATLVICVIANPILHYVTGMNNINAVLPWVGGVALVLISMLLTLIAGLLPSRLAAKKDPVEALRTE